MIVLGLLIVISIPIVQLFSGMSFLSGFGSFTEEREETVEEEISPEDGLSERNLFYPVWKEYKNYVLPDSDTAYLCYRDIANLTGDARTIAREEIYARHGKTFDDPALQAYFDARSWYKAGDGDFEANSYEQANLDLLRVYESMENGSLYRFGNRFVDACPDASSYILESSSTRLLTGRDLQSLSETELCIARNEIYARKGYLFADPELREYFYSRSWYQPTVAAAEFDFNSLTETESKNLELIQTYENMAENDVSWSYDNPYQSVYAKYSYQSYVFPYSSYSYLSRSDLYGMSVDELCIARNEIYARHGYTFTADQLLEYFRHYSWYTPKTAPGDVNAVSLNAVETANVELLNQAENEARQTSDRIFREDNTTDNSVDLSSLDTTLGYTVSHEMFSVTLPNYFKTYARISNSQDSLSIKEKSSNDAGWGGHLFTFTLGEIDPPNGGVIGRLSKDGVEYVLTVWGATDVQHTQEAYELYFKMDGERSRVIATITGINGWTFTPAS